MKFKCFDLETTGVDVETATVVQAAVVVVDSVTEQGLANAERHEHLFAARDVPVGATQVHRITDRDPERFDFPVRVIPIGALPFGQCAATMSGVLTEDDTVAVSFNGCAYDIPIVARFAAPSLGCSREAVAARLRARHVDVMRLWWRVRGQTKEAPWQYELRSSKREACDPDWTVSAPRLTSDMFAGSLTAAHGFFFGEPFDDAHDATVDCAATLRVLSAMLSEGFVPDVETAIRWSNLPLPGDVDFGGKFKWEGDTAVITIGKQAGMPLESVDRGFLRWMLDKDFADDTKAIVRNYLTRGEYPQRRYEDET